MICARSEPDGDESRPYDAIRRRRRFPFPEPPLSGTSFVLRAFRAEDFDGGAASWSRILRRRAGCHRCPARRRLGGRRVLRALPTRRRAPPPRHRRPGSGAYLGETMVALGEHGVGEVGCCVVPAVRGQGIATETLRALTDWAFGALGLGACRCSSASRTSPRSASPRPRVSAARACCAATGRRRAAVSTRSSWPASRAIRRSAPAPTSPSTWRCRRRGRARRGANPNRRRRRPAPRR